MIELMTAMALAAVVAAALIPIVMSGKRIEKRSMEQTAALMAGDGVFEYLKEELRYADKIRIEPPKGESTKCSDSDTSRKIMLCSEAEEWKEFRVIKAASGKGSEFVLREAGKDRIIFSEVYLNGLEPDIELRILKRGKAELSVILRRGDRIVYKRKEDIELLNADKHSPASSARSTKRRVRGDAYVSGS